MIQLVSLDSIVESSHEVAGLEAIARQLAGEEFFQLSFSYGDELKLHFGTPRPHKHPSLRHLLQGSLVLCTVASDWKLSTANPPRMFSPQEDETRGVKEEELEKEQPIARGIMVTAVQVIPSILGWGLALTWADGSKFVILPELEASDDDCPNWELYTAQDRVLHVGPGHKWSYLPNRRPTKETASAPPEIPSSDENPAAGGKVQFPTSPSQ